MVAKTLAVAIGIKNQFFWTQFRVTASSMGLSYTRALEQAARMWLDKQHREGRYVPQDPHREEMSWAPRDEA